ncbi:glycosyltransferase family 2 protein [Butyrivibrio fibrisolvens]|uniref:glycosyltransferase family 2 protein n=1 Tax=Butyrivibrio fibrisolvens TaxID=831 RepID=UPI0003B39866|nr:glycosyltransferase [Butyrivibrio fibrisolvens]
MEAINSKLSIIVPVYNIDKYIGKCIDSIRSSTYTNLEVILVDDGSTDNSGNICDYYKQRDDRIIVVHKTNGGLVSARKAGVSIATGEYVAFVDGDDFVDSDLYSNAIEKLIETKADMICFGYTRWDNEGKKREVARNSLSDGIYNSSSYSVYYDEKKQTLSFIHSACTKVFRTSFLKSAVIEVNDVVTKGEDLNITLSYLKLASSFCIDNTITGYMYVDRSTSITRTYDNKSIEHTANYVDSSMKLCDKTNDSKLYLWDKIVYNEAFNLIKSDCIGCAFEHYGKKGLLKLILFFREMANNNVFYNLFDNGLKKQVFSGKRAWYAHLMIKKRYISALILRLRYKEL